ncbi:MAG TPA: rod shape-determining protein MreD [Gaiellaceae bacterium]|nr:rod shape-determining protein MreD [Gaiellaceae bacterium]
MVADAVKAGAMLFVAALLQVTVLNRLQILGGTPDLLLLTLVGVSLLRGSVFGAAGGFGAGLVVDTADLGTLGLTSLVLTVAGYWIGRYGETTGRDRRHAPFVSVAVVTVLASFGELVLHFMIGDHVSARLVLVDALFPSILLNLLLTAPVYALCRRLLRPQDWSELATEVRLLG